MNCGSCSICTLNFNTTDISALKCGHTYHYECIDKWLINSKTCPNCRTTNTKRDITKLFFDECDKSFRHSDFAERIEELKSRLEFARRSHNNRIEEILRKRQIEMTSLESANRRIKDLEAAINAEMTRRLNITPSTSPSTSTAGQNITASNIVASPRPMSPRLSTPLTQNQSLTTVRRGTKRSRLIRDAYVSTYDNTSKLWKSTGNANGDLKIGEVDMDGQYITLRNKGTENIAIGGWKLKSVASGPEVTFKLPSCTVIKAGKTVTIWSSNSGQEHQPPSNLVMKLQQWPQGDLIRTELLNSDREVEAWTEVFLQHSSMQTDKNRRVT